MEHLPIFIFEIVLIVFIAFAVFAKILIECEVKQRKKINELYEQIKLRDMQLQELEKFVHLNTEMVSCVAELQPMYYKKDPNKYLDSLCERIGHSMVNQMSLKFNKRMLKRIKELLMDGYLRSEFLNTDVMSLKTRFRVSVPIFRVDYDYIKLSRAEDIFG